MAKRRRDEDEEGDRTSYTVDNYVSGSKRYSDYINVLEDLEWLRAVIDSCKSWDSLRLQSLLENRPQNVIERLQDKRLHKTMKHPLYVAAQYNFYNGAEILLKWPNLSIDVNYTNADRVSPLYISCHYGHVRLVELLFNHGASLSITKKDGGTCIYSACKHGHLNVIQLLVKLGANVAKSWHRGRSLLHVAAQHGWVQIVEYFLDVLKVCLCA